MKRKIGLFVAIGTLLSLMCIVPAGCSSKEEKGSGEAKPVMAPLPSAETQTLPPAAAADQPGSPVGAAASAETAPSPKAGSDPNTAIEVEGVKLARKTLDADVKKKLDEVKAQIPPASLEQAKAEIRKSLIDEFIAKTLLNNEIARKNITASDKEVDDVLNAMKGQLPPGVTFEELLKKNKLDLAKMRQEIAMTVRVNKLVEQELGGKGKVSDKERADFYNKNIDQFKQPETVHARHILITVAAGDSEKLKAEKKAKAEDLRKQLVAGADFPALAAKHSDCPSKQNGGDLGTFARGQMVKPFEDAAFSQEKNAIGPVIQTDFGFHIIQVLERTSAKVMKLDDELRKRIGAYLENQKQQEAFANLLKRLKAAANIVLYAK